MTQSNEVFERIVRLLQANDVAFNTKEHVPTFTSQESADARGEPLAIGGKALLLKANKTFVLCVLQADCKLDSAVFKSSTGTKKLRFASADELKDLTGLVPGSVPPFGKPVLPFDLYIDERIMNQDRIAFNAGMLTKSIVMATSDYYSVNVDAQVGKYSTPPETDEND